MAYSPPQWLISSAQASQELAAPAVGKIETLANVTQNTIYLMGFSFMLGSLFTILILILLDFMRRNANAKKD